MESADTMEMGRTLKAAVRPKTRSTTAGMKVRIQSSCHHKKTELVKIFPPSEPGEKVPKMLQRFMAEGMTAKEYGELRDLVHADWSTKTESEQEATYASLQRILRQYFLVEHLDVDQDGRLEYSRDLLHLMQ